jgi:hypothetical protein
LSTDESERCIPIPGFETMAQVEGNAGAMAYGPLGAGQIAKVGRPLAQEQAEETESAGE